MQRHQESPQQGQKRFQNAKQRMEIIRIQHRDQAKTVLELRNFHLTVRLRMLEDDFKPPQPTVHLPYQEPSKNRTNILAQDHLQPTSFCPLPPRQHEHHHHVKAMEMDRACDEKRARQHTPHSPSLDTRGEAETGPTQEHLASNCKRGAQDFPSHLGDCSETGPEQTGVEYLCCCPTCQPA